MVNDELLDPFVEWTDRISISPYVRVERRYLKRASTLIVDWFLSLRSKRPLARQILRPAFPPVKRFAIG